MLAYLWSKWTIRAKRAPIGKQATAKLRLIPRVEVLEDRWLPSTVIAEYPVLTAGSGPVGITTGPDGNVWFTEFAAGQIGVINPTSHTVAEFEVPTASSGPDGITAGPNDSIWFTEYAADQIGEINVTTHTVSEFAIPTPDSGPSGITAGPDGNIWFTEQAAGKIGMINPTTDVISEFTTPTIGSGPQGITAGPDGNIWFTESAGNNIGTINPTTHVITEYAVPQVSSAPYQITAGSNGDMFFTEAAGNAIGAISITSHAFDYFAVPTASSGPLGITTGADGNIWFTEYAAGQIGEFNLSTGHVSETPLPTASAYPTQIINGPGGALWYTESVAGQIGEVVSAKIATNPASQTVVDGQTATFTAAVDGFPAPTVQWEVSTGSGASFTPLTNGGIYSGVTTNTLTISDATTAMNGYEYEAVYTAGASPTTSTTTSAATLTVNTALSITPTLPQGIVGVNYNQTLWVVGNSTSYSNFSVSNFNPGTTGLSTSDITTDAVNGAIIINGTPTAAGSATFTVSAATTGGDSMTRNLTITVRRPLSITTSSLSVQTAGIDYSQAITVVGGVLPFTTFNVTNFNAGTTGLTAGDITTLPASSEFKVAGTPTAGGTATFTVNVTDSAGTTVTKNFTLTVNPPLAFTPSLAEGTAGTIYNQTLKVSGGGAPYTSLIVNHFSAGATGLTVGDFAISTAGASVTIDGTPTAAGTFSFNVDVVDSVGAAALKTYSVTINPKLSITPSLPLGVVGTDYHRIITVAGGTKPYSTLTVTGFSAGTTGLSASDITLSPAAGTVVITGTPNAAGTAAFTVNVTDAAGSQLTQAFKIAINAPPTLGNLTTTQWTVGRSGFTGVIPISGGAGPFTIISDSGLPTGLTAAVSGDSIAFKGTPSAARTFANVSITIHDAADASAAKTFSITINPALAVGNPTVTQWTKGLSGFVGVMTVSGGTSALSITGSSGLPAGLTAAVSGNTVRIAGTPTAAGAFSGSVTLRDAAGATVTKTVPLTINPPPTLGNQTRTQWTAGVPGFDSTIAISGGTGPFSIASVSGLPTGVTATLLGRTISFTGTPSAAQTFADGTITIHDAAGASVTKTFSITINPALAVGNPTVTQWTKGLSGFVSVMTVSGGGSSALSITGSSGLPAGLTAAVSGNTVRIAGTPTAAGTFSGSITLRDAAGATVTKTVPLTINPPPTLGNQTITQWTAGVSGFDSTIAISGGTGPFTLASVSGLPTGVTAVLSGRTISFTGTPSAAQTFADGTITIHDAAGASAAKTFSITINPALAVGNPTATQWTKGLSGFVSVMTVSGGGSSALSITGSSGLPAGLTAAVSGNTVRIAGTPTAAGTFSGSITLRDAAGATVTKTVPLTINPPPTLGNQTITQWTAGVSGFDSTIAISGGTGPFTLASVSGLPTGVTAVLSGRTISFTGTPSAAQTFADGTITIHDAAGASAAKTFSITINPALAVGNPTATQWTKGLSGFVSVMTVSGGSALSITGSSGLPAGLTAVVSGNTVRIAGTPTAAGTFSGSITLRDGAGATITKTVPLTINPPPTLGNQTMTQWTAGVPGFDSTIAISGGTGPFSIANVSGLPTGVTAVLSGNTISFTGTPSAAQTFADGTITIHDAAGASVTKTFSITINPPLQITTTSLSATTTAALNNTTLHTTGGTGIVTFAIAGGSLPPGMKLSSAGVITGASQSSGSFTVTITATDAIGDKVSQKYTLSLSSKST